MLATWMKTQNKMSQGARDQIYTILNKIQRNVVISCSCFRAKVKTYFNNLIFRCCVKKYWIRKIPWWKGTMWRRRPWNLMSQIRANIKKNIQKCSAIWLGWDTALVVYLKIRRQSINILFLVYNFIQYSTSRWITVTAVSIISLMILASVQDKAFKILPLTLRKSLKQHITRPKL